VTFLRLSRWDWLAFVAALALLVTMSGADWWTDRQGQECRRIERLQTPPPRTGPLGDQFGGDIRRAARECAEKHEKTAWQAGGLIDWIIKLVLAGAIAAAIGAAFARAGGREPRAPTPSALAGALGLLGTLLLLYRILQPPGPNYAAVVKAGAPICLAIAGILTIAARLASISEREAPTAPSEPPPEGPAGSEAPAESG
jgi:hypothetical protein